MTDSYDIQGVKITPTAGGYYDLEHASLGEPERVRGKEKAEQRAQEIAKAAAPAEGSMQPQGDLMVSGATGQRIERGDTRSEAERSQEHEAHSNARDDNLDPLKKPAESDAAKQTQADKDRETASVMETVRPPVPAPPTGDDKDQEIAQLKAQHSELSSKFDQLLDALKPAVATVTTVAEPEPTPQIGAIPNRFTGEMSAEGKKALKAAGLTYSTVVLEENESIPPTGLFVSHNGRAYQISPGEEVDVPDFILGVLDDAVTSAPIVDSNSQKVLGYRNRSKYPYRRVK